VSVLDSLEEAVTLRKGVTRVKTHLARTKTGKVVTVREHNERRKDAGKKTESADAAMTRAAKAAKAAEAVFRRAEPGSAQYKTAEKKLEFAKELIRQYKGGAPKKASKPMPSPAPKRTVKTADHTAEKPLTHKKPTGLPTKPTKTQGTLLGIEPAKPKSGRGKEYVDVGQKIGGARKDLAALYREGKLRNLASIDLEALEKDPDLAAKVATKANLLEDAKPDALRQMGKDPATAFRITKALETIAPKPVLDSANARAAYIKAVDRIKRALLNCNTPDEVRSAVNDLRQEASGYYYTAAEKKRIDKADAEWEKAREAEEAARKARDSYSATFSEPIYRIGQDDPRRKKWQALQDAFIAAGKKASDVSPSRVKYDIQRRNQDDPAGWPFAYKMLGDRAFPTVSTIKSTFFKEHLGRRPDDWSWHDGKTAKPRTTKDDRGGLPKWEREVPEEAIRKGGKAAKYDAKALMKAFGIRGVEFGNWMEDAASAHHVQKAGEALMDLSDALGIDPKLISYGGRLAIAFGARGKGKALAHYEPGKKVINMTKFAGGGSLAHEWGHFLDNVISMVSEGGGMSFVSDSPGRGNLHQDVKDAYGDWLRNIRFGTVGARGIPVKPDESQFKSSIQYSSWSAGEMYLRKFNGDPQHAQAAMEERYSGSSDAARKKWAEWFASKTGRTVEWRKKAAMGGKSHFLATAEQMGDYWKRPHEMFARCWEAYVEDKLAKNRMTNSYLVSGTGTGGPKRSGLGGEIESGGMAFRYSVYPTGDERERNFAAMERLVAAIKSSGILKKALDLAGPMCQESGMNPLEDLEAAVLRKSHVRTFTRRSKTGKVETVQEHEDARSKKAKPAPKNRGKSKAEMDAHRPYADSDPELVGAIKAANAAQTILRRAEPGSAPYKAAMKKLEVAQELIRRHAKGGSAKPSKAEKEHLGPIKKPTKKQATAKLAQDALKPTKKVSAEKRTAQAKLAADKEMATHKAKIAKDAAEHQAKLKQQEREHQAKLQRQQAEHQAKLGKDAAEHQGKIAEKADKRKAALGKESDTHKASLAKDGASHKAKLDQDTKGAVPTDEHLKAAAKDAMAEHANYMESRRSQAEARDQKVPHEGAYDKGAKTLASDQHIGKLKGSDMWQQKGPVATLEHHADLHKKLADQARGKGDRRVAATHDGASHMATRIAGAMKQRMSGGKDVAQQSDKQVAKQLAEPKKPSPHPLGAPPGSKFAEALDRRKKTAEAEGESIARNAVKNDLTQKFGDRVSRGMARTKDAKAGDKPTGKDALDAIHSYFKTAAQRRKEIAEAHDKSRQEMHGKNDKAPGPGQRGSFHISHWEAPTKKVQGIHSKDAPGLMAYRQGKEDYAIHHIASGAKVFDGYRSEESATRAMARLGSEHPQHGKPDWTKPEKEVMASKAAGELARAEAKNNPKDIFGKRIR
jgi:hypothetical protein